MRLMSTLPRRVPTLPNFSTLRSSRPLALLGALTLLCALLTAGYVRGGGAPRFSVGESRRPTIGVNEAPAYDAAKVGGGAVSGNGSNAGLTSDLAGQTVSGAAGQRAAAPAPATAGAPSAPQQVLPPFSPSIV